jgi:hypothetical protein
MASRPLRLSLLPLLALTATTAALFPASDLLRPVRARSTATGDKGAQVYCFMRSNGNSHEVSWNAAYALIKRQSAGVFKTSPEHAAVMITESVVNSPETYPECGRFLGDLYNRHAPSPAALDTTPSHGSRHDAAGYPGPMTREERYGY